MEGNETLSQWQNTALRIEAVSKAEWKWDKLESTKVKY
jgi:hypothetical protein